MPKPILVTGAHRSGSTWVGTTLDLSKEIRYIYEPFNIGAKRRWSPVDCWFEYVSENQSTQRQDAFRKYVRRFIQGSVTGWLDDTLRIDSVGEFKAYLLRYTGYLSRKRVLIKDPIAVMSADWLANTFDMDVVIITRHPAAFAASLKVKNWRFNFNNLLDQESLIQEVLSPFAQEIQYFAQHEQPIIRQAALLWNIIYFRVHQYQQQYPHWLFRRHEDISREPLAEFEDLFTHLNLRYTEPIRARIQEMTATPERDGLHRDSQKNINSWQKRLSEDEIRETRKMTQEIASFYYTDADW